MTVDPESFRIHFERFCDRVQRASGKTFISFKEGVAAEWEGYKEPLRQEALRRIDAASISEAVIGQGEILDRLVSCIEIARGPGVEPNNLVRWENRYGHANRSHHAILDARGNPDSSKEIESWTFEFYRGSLPYPEAFDRLRRFVGSRYDLVAYLFFLKDSDEFMPIAPTSFDRAFASLGIDLVTTQRCSWDNYQRYNKILKDIRTTLIDLTGNPDIRLIDAHSFCWILIRPEFDRVEASAIPAKKSKGTAKIFNAQERSIWRMTETTLNTVRHANGQQVLVTKKIKELWMGKGDLEEHIKLLLKTQEDKCALTGIQFQYDGEHIDHQLLPSLDRKDSNGHYAEGNLQVVCKFINKWKSDERNDEFIRLLALVRHDDF